MKSVPFDYVRPKTLESACSYLSKDPNSLVLAGGQSLLPMLSMRLARPSILVDIAHIKELKIIESADWNNGYIVGEDFKDKEDENTISLLNRFIDESDISLDKSRVKGLITNIYRKACEVE